ncbi:MAG TPA: 4Fe-4S dicluster domain-containing protein [bacterium]|nr:4Fe-4S dicluster domain-containing protein [bacterium]
MKLDRREFLRSIGLTAFSLSMVPDTRRGPIAKLFSSLIPAEEIIPGMPYWYASTCRECPAGCGVMLKVSEGNVIKIEGNPNHPINRGGLCIRGQAALQELYNVDRIKHPTFFPTTGAKQKLDWERALKEIASKIGKGRTALLTGKLSGAQKRLAERWVRSLGNASLVEYEPLNRLSYIRANKILFNRLAVTQYHLNQPDLVLSFGADFMETWQSPVAMMHRFSQARRFDNGRSAKMIYLGIVDSLTAANADQNHSINPGSEAVVMLTLARWLLQNDEKIKLTVFEKNRWLKSLAKFTLENAARLSGLPEETIIDIARQLANSSAPVALCGESLSAHERATDSQITVNILNYITGAYGKTISLGEENSAAYRWSVHDFEAFVRSMEAGQISNLIIYNTNPVYLFPDRRRMEDALTKVRLKVVLATTMNETALFADYLLPVHHACETWGIDEPAPDIFSLVQPGMDPIYDSRAMEDILLSISSAGMKFRNMDHFFREEWERVFRRLSPNLSFEENWTKILIQGGVWQQPDETLSVPTVSNQVHNYLANFRMPQKVEGMTLAVQVSARFWDGRGANKSWLWEIPEPIHHVVWDTPVRLHPKVSEKLGLREGDIVRLSIDGRSIEAPVLITNMVHPQVIAMEIGAGHFGTNAVQQTGNPLQLLPAKFDLLSGDAVMMADSIEINPTGKWRKLARLQGSYQQGARNIIQQISLEKAIALQKSGAERKRHPAPQINPVHQHPNFDWAMVIDLSACNGCGACVAACYAENNVPVVGKDQCERGREMAWIRIERFELDGRSRFIPMMCQQCEAAPCETVCPVYANVHSDEGLNIQVYNRCVGTRYCSNNCPYKVRRFNYFSTSWVAPTNRQLNPDIYHRPKGVMEKCTFCVHRIRKAKEDAKIERRTVQDGEVMPACAQSCPTQAISFGDLNDPNSRVSQLINDFRAYVVFEELNTQPSVVYLKGIKHG